MRLGKPRKEFDGAEGPQGRASRSERVHLARMIWAMIVSGQPYDETKAFAITAASTARRLKNLRHQAKALNMTLVPA